MLTWKSVCSPCFFQQTEAILDSEQRLASCCAYLRVCVHTHESLLSSSCPPAAIHPQRTPPEHLLALACSGPLGGNERKAGEALLWRGCRWRGHVSLRVTQRKLRQPWGSWREEPAGKTFPFRSVPVHSHTAFLSFSGGSFSFLKPRLSDSPSVSLSELIVSRCTLPPASLHVFPFSSSQADISKHFTYF